MVAGGLAAAGPAGAATASVGVAGQGSFVFAVGVGFAPPNEFCRALELRIDGALVPVISRRSDDTGTWVLGFRATQARRVHRLAISQVCESGRDGSLRTTAATASFRIR